MILNLEIFKPNVINMLFNITNNILILIILLININPYITIRQNVQVVSKLNVIEYYEYDNQL